MLLLFSMLPALIMWRAPIAAHAAKDTRAIVATLNVSTQAYLRAKTIRSPRLHAMMFTPQTWFVRADGGSLYNASTAPTGQCDGQGDAAYPGSGTNQHCAVDNVWRLYLNGTFGLSSWSGVSGFTGGDTLVIRGCDATSGEVNPDPPHCRIGTMDANFSWSMCQGISAPQGCSMPPIPSGSSGAHTKILGGCAYGTYTCTAINTGYPYGTTNEAQLFGGWATGTIIDLRGSSYVDIEGIEVTSHNGACTRYGSPMWPKGCSVSIPVDDFAQDGVLFSPTSTNINLTDVYIHGLVVEGLGGPFGAGLVFTRVFSGFNVFAGFNMDDGSSTPDGTGASLTQTMMTMIGNGCLEEYPIVHTQFPAKACWDSGTGGFGDAWSGQNTNLDTFTCDQCRLQFNAKDDALGPHTLVKHLVLTNSMFDGSMGQEGKWGLQAGSTSVILNNLILGRCMSMSRQLPGAPQNFNISTGLNGSYLTTFCRAAGPVFDWFNDTGSTAIFANNTFVTYQPNIFEGGCATANTCGPVVFRNNIYLGYTSTYTGSPFNAGQMPVLFLDWTGVNPSDYTADHNVEFGVSATDPCGGTIHCTDPLLVSEPAQGSGPVPETVLDNFNFHSTSGSPAVGAGATYTGILSTDYYGTPYSSPPPIGAVMASGTPPASGGSVRGGNVVISGKVVQ